MIGGEKNDKLFASRDARRLALDQYVRQALPLLDPEPLRPGLIETPRRVAASLSELTSGYDVDVESLFTTFDREEYDGIVTQTDIPFYSLCEHHLLPFVGRAHVAYISEGRIVGLSKIARVVDAYARRLQTQERMTTQIAEAFRMYLAADGVIVILEAEHFCMTMRGAKVAGSITRTSALRGIFHDDHSARMEALDLMISRRRPA